MSFCRALCAFVIAGLFAAPALILSGAPALAAEGNLRHPELQKYRESGGRVDFLGHELGLDGWLLTKEGQAPSAVYTTPEGGLVRGMLVGTDGNVETLNQLVGLKKRLEGDQSAMPGAEQGDGPKAEKFYARVEKASWVEVGDKDAPYVYMFFNATCAECQETFQLLQKALTEKKLRLRLAPFGAAAENAKGGAAILSAADPAKAWLDFIGGNKDALFKIPPKPRAGEAVANNGKMLQSFGVKGAPPYLVYRRLTDGQVTVIVGKPANPLLVLADLIKPAAMPDLPGLEDLPTAEEEGPVTDPLPAPDEMPPELVDPVFKRMEDGAP